MILILIIWLRV